MSDAVVAVIEDAESTVTTGAELLILVNTFIVVPELSKDTKSGLLSPLRSAANTKIWELDTVMYDIAKLSAPEVL